MKTVAALRKEFDVDVYDTMIEGPEHVGMPTSMQEHCGKRVTIEELVNDYYEVKEDSYSWYDWMFEEPIRGELIPEVDKPRDAQKQMLDLVGVHAHILYGKMKKLTEAVTTDQLVEATAHATDVLKALVAIRTLNEICVSFDRAAVIKSLRETEGDSMRKVHGDSSRAHGAVNKESIEQAARNAERLKDK